MGEMGEIAKISELFLRIKEWRLLIVSFGFVLGVIGGLGLLIGLDKVPSLSPWHFIVLIIIGVSFIIIGIMLFREAERRHGRELVKELNKFTERFLSTRSKNSRYMDEKSIVEAFKKSKEVIENLAATMESLQSRNKKMESEMRQLSSEVEELNRRMSEPGWVLKRVVKLSNHPITIVFAKKVGQRITEASITAASPRANQFYGYLDGSDDLIGKQSGDLLSLLRNWMDEEDYRRFEVDQRRILEQLESGRVANARVPMRLNHRHPNVLMRNRVFWPIIVGRSGERSVEGSERIEYLTIMYLDLSLLPPECRKVIGCGGDE